MDKIIEDYKNLDLNYEMEDHVLDDFKVCIKYIEHLESEAQKSLSNTDYEKCLNCDSELEITGVKCRECDYTDHFA